MCVGLTAQCEPEYRVVYIHKRFYILVDGIKADAREVYFRDLNWLECGLVAGFCDNGCV